MTTPPAVRMGSYTAAFLADHLRERIEEIRSGEVSYGEDNAMILAEFEDVLRQLREVK